MISKTHEKNFKQSQELFVINPYTVYLYPYIGPDNRY